MSDRFWSRRDLIKVAAAVGLAPTASVVGDEVMRTRSIPVSNEPLPVIGLGTYNVFDVQGTPAEITERREILDLFTAKGASLIDTSPMYNRSEKIIGDVLRESRNREQLFIATKVWIDGKAAGEGQMQQSADLMNAGTIDLMQVHNLRDLDAHMATIRDWQAEKRIRYNGVTHYRASALDDLEAVMRSQKPEFIQTLVAIVSNSLLLPRSGSMAKRPAKVKCSSRQT